LIEFHAADGREWYKGTFTMNENTNPKQIIFTVADCPAPKYIGKVGNAIYRLENGLLIIAGNEPGNPAMPKGFDDPDSRHLEFSKQ
jgi:uncharacterized protein (TIGR03067 family)